MQVINDLSSAADDALVREYYPLVQQVVSGLQNRLPKDADMEELHSVGVTGLVEAIRRYDPERVPTFHAYALIRIRGAILDELRRMDTLSRQNRAHSRLIRDAVAELEQELGRVPSDHEIASRLNISLHQFDRMRQRAQPISLLSIDQTVGTDPDTSGPLSDYLADDTELTSLEILERNESRQILRERINCLPERQREVLRQYYFEGRKLAEIAVGFGVTEARVCQIHTQALGILRHSLSRVN
jgi:RNA polymerase sigma factor for flagellar operon FliA